MRPRFDVRYELRARLPEALQDKIRAHLTDVAASLAQLIDPQSPFWRNEQGLKTRVDGVIVDYRIDLDDRRVMVTNVIKRD